MGGLTGAGNLEAAQQQQQAAQMRAIGAQEKMRQEAMAQMAPYREYGARALPQLTASLQPGSQLGTMRSTLGQQALQSQAGMFDPRILDEIMGQYQGSVGAQESTARTMRARDIMNLGMGSAVQGAGMAGQTGRGLADMYLQGAAQQGQMAAQQAAARQQGTYGAMYGGWRGLQNYLGGAYG
jgi:hypothetical protein